MSQKYSHSFIKDNAVALIGHVFVYMNGLILMPIIIKTVGVAEYGGYVLLATILNFAFGISSFGVGFRAKRYLPSANTMEARRELFYPQFLMTLLSIFCISLLLMLSSGLLNRFFFKQQISYSVAIMPMFLISYFLYAQGSDYFRYTSRIKHMTVANVVFPYLSIGFVLCFFYGFDIRSVNALFVAQACSALLIAIPCFITVLREIRFRIVLTSWEQLRSDVKLGFPIVLNFIVDYVLTGIDRYFIAFFMGVLAVGCYNPAYVLGSVIIFIPKAMSTVIPQLLSKAVDSGQEDSAHRLVDYSLKAVLLVSVPFFFGSLLMAKPILTLLADADVAARAHLVTPVVALGTLFYGLNITLSNVLFVKLDTAAIFKTNLFAALFNVVANCVGLYFFRNILVAAITTFLSYALVFFYITNVVQKKAWPLCFDFTFLVKTIFASVCMVAFLLLLSMSFPHHHTIPIVIVKLVGAVAVYGGALYALRTFSSQEVAFLRKAFARST